MRRVPQEPLEHQEPTNEAAEAAVYEAGDLQTLAHCISWVRLLKRIFNIDLRLRANFDDGKRLRRGRTEGACATPTGR
jgi:hypothetical protein